MDLIADALLTDDFRAVLSSMRDDLLREYFYSLGGSMPGGSVDYRGNWMSFYGREEERIRISAISVYPGLSFEDMFPAEGGGARKTGVHFEGASYMFIGNYENGLAHGDFTIYKSYDDRPETVLVVSLKADEGHISPDIPVRIEAADGGELPDTGSPEEYLGIDIPVPWGGPPDWTLEFWDLQ
jgi:hypothetical protein